MDEAIPGVRNGNSFEDDDNDRDEDFEVNDIEVYI